MAPEARARSALARAVGSAHEHQDEAPARWLGQRLPVHCPRGDPSRPGLTDRLTGEEANRSPDQGSADELRRLRGAAPRQRRLCPPQLGCEQRGRRGRRLRPSPDVTSPTFAENPSGSPLHSLCTPPGRAEGEPLAGSRPPGSAPSRTRRPSTGAGPAEDGMSRLPEPTAPCRPLPPDQMQKWPTSRLQVSLQAPRRALKAQTNPGPKGDRP